MSLLSNGSKFPKNTQSNFTTILENPIELIGNYQVALVEISNFSNFSINMGKISYKNPYFLSGAYANRAENIEFNLRLDNGLTLSQFCNKINFEIHNSFVKEEILYRQKLANENATNFMDQMQVFNEIKSNVDRPLLNVIKKSPDEYEIIDKIDSLFQNIFKKCHGNFNSLTQRFQLKNIDALKDYFQLLIIRVPTFELNDASTYYLNQAYILKNDSFLVDHSSVEKEWMLIDKKEMNLKTLEDIYTNSTKIASQFNAQEDLLNPNDYFIFLPFLKLLNSHTIVLETAYEITFYGLISQLINNSDIIKTLKKSTAIFNLAPYIQLTKYSSIHKYY